MQRKLAIRRLRIDTRSRRVQQLGNGRVPTATCEVQRGLTTLTRRHRAGAQIEQPLDDIDAPIVRCGHEWDLSIAPCDADARALIKLSWVHTVKELSDLDLPRIAGEIQRCIPVGVLGMDVLWRDRVHPLHKGEAVVAARMVKAAVTRGIEVCQIGAALCMQPSGQVIVPVTARTMERSGSIAVRDIGTSAVEPHQPLGHVDVPILARGMDS